MPVKALVILLLAMSSLSLAIASTASPAYAEELPSGSMLIAPCDSFVKIVYTGSNSRFVDTFGYVNYPANDPEDRTQIGSTDTTSIGATTELGDFAAGQELILYLENEYGLLWLTGPADRCCFDLDTPHAKIYRINDSTYRVSFEDTSKAFSDMDYDDVVLDVYFIRPTARVTVATGAGGLVNVPSTSTGTVTLSRAFSQPVTVTVAAGNGTAQYGSDYALGISGATDSSAITFNFDPGTTSRTFEVRVKDDGVYSTPNEHFDVYIASTSGNIIADTTPVTVTLSEQYLAPTVRLGQATCAVSEPAAGTTVGMPFTVVLSQPCAFDTTVGIGTIAGSAAAGTNYDATVASVVIPAGQTTGTGSVTIKGDGLYSSPARTFEIAIVGTDHSLGTGTPGRATVTINEYSSSTPPVTPTVQLSSDHYTTLEPAPGTTATVPFTVTLSEACSFDVTVNLDTAAGTATPGPDYDPSVAAVTIHAGATSAAGSLTVRNDGLYSLADQTFTLKVGGATAPIGIGTQSQATVTITDLSSTGPVPAVQLNATAYSIDEPSGYLTTDMPFNVTISEPCDFPVMVTIITVPGTAVIIDDFTTLSTYVVIPPGETSARGYVTVKGDGRYSSTDSYFKLQISSVDNFLAIGSPREATVTIKEATGAIPTVRFNSTTYEIDEPAGSVSTTRVPFNVTLSQPCDAQVMVTVVTVSGTATPIDDYTTLIDPVIIKPGESSGTGYVTVKGDGKYSAEDQQFKLKIIGATTPLTIGTPAEATVTIKEATGTAPTVTFNASAYSIDEPSGYLTADMPFNVTLSEPCDFPVTVYIGTDMGTALPVDDYTTTIAPVLINPGEISGTGYVTVKGDGLYSAEDQQFKLKIIGATTPLTIGTPGEATVTIKESATSGAPTLQFSAPEYAAAEPFAGVEGSVLFTVTVSQPCDFDTLVHLGTVDGTAIAGKNYAGAVTDVVIPAGAGSAIGSVTILSDYTYIPADVAFKLKITGNNRSLSAGAPAEATITIANSDQKPVVQLNASTYTAPEGGTGYANITLTGNSSTPVVIQYTIDGVPGTYTFDPATQGYVLIPVTVPNQPGVQTGRTLSFVITGVSDNARLSLPDSATIHVQEKEQTYVVHLTRGWNMISVPIVIEPFMVSELNALNGNVTRAMMYDAATQQYKPYKVGASSEYDFEFRTDMGYLIYSTNDTELTFAGEAPEGRSVQLADSWNMVGWSTFGTSDAISVCGMLAGSQRIMTYDAASQAYLPYKELAPADYNFPMGPGFGYLIYSNTTTPLNWGVFK